VLVLTGSKDYYWGVSEGIYILPTVTAIDRLYKRVYVNGYLGPVVYIREQFNKVTW
jgi:CRISPR/Cas system-associated endonuclease/helicase Cas3